MQWIKKKGRRKPYKHGDFSCKPVLVVTSCDNIAKTWIMEKKMVHKSAKELMERLSTELTTDAWLTDLAEIVEFFYQSLAAGDIGHEYLGDHGKPGLAWPPLETYDMRFMRLKGAPH